MKPNPPFRTYPAAPIMVMALGVLYLLFSVGVVKATHFCMGREASVAYFTAEPKKCGCSTFAENGDHCCDDTQDLINLEDSQKIFSTFQLPLPELSFLGVLYSMSPALQDRLETHFPRHAEEVQPPPKPLFEWHCSFVFYDKRTMT